MVPRSVKREIHKQLQLAPEGDPEVDLKALLVAEELASYGEGDGPQDREKDVATLQKMMKEPADGLEYEKAALLRDRIKKLQGEAGG
jgi:excinuclease UvrABC helicase subunit UvrB